MTARDEIIIDGIRCLGHHGAFPDEKLRAQPFLLSLRMQIDLSEPARSDTLVETVDYSEIHKRVVDTVKSTSFNLLERLADEILSRLFADKRIFEATISIGKPALLEGATATVSLRRKNDE